MLCIGHRGAMGYEPENTLRSITRAIELGADWVEIDVYNVEGRLVVFHDDTLERCTNGQGSIQSSSLTYLRSLDAGRGEQIPFLEEVFALINKRVGVNVELKGTDTCTVVASFLQQQVQHGWKNAHLLVSSFDYSQLRQFKKLAPEIHVGVLIDNDVESAMHLADEIFALSVNPPLSKADKVLLERIHNAGRKAFVYTVNEVEDIERMRRVGVDGIFTNYPDRVVK